MAVTMNTFWDNSGTVIPGGDAEYVVAEQPIAEYDNWFNYNVVADIQAVIDDVINKFNANTILKADTDNTPAALVVAEQTIVGRKTGNSIAALIDSEVLAIIGVEPGATADQTNTEIRDAVEAAADSNTFTDADHTKLNGVEALADVTDTTNVAASGATMESLFDANTILKADSNDTPAALTVAEQTLVGRITAGVITALTASQVRILIGVADGADVTGSNTPQAHASSHEDGADRVSFFTNNSGDISSSRSINTVYQNTTGKLMFVTVVGHHSTSTSLLKGYTDSFTPPTTIVGLAYPNQDQRPISFFVQPNGYYKVTLPASGGTPSIEMWFEAY